MFSINGFDPKILTDDQLFEKQLELTRKSLQASRFGKVEITGQLQMMIQAIEFERRERMFNSIIGKHMLRSSSVVIETDPDLKAIELQAEEEENPKPKASTPTNRQVRRPIRTLKPLTVKADQPNER